jgi:O-antigen ligase
MYLALAAFAALLPLYVVRLTLPVPGLRLPTTLLEVLFLALFAAWLALRGRRPEAWEPLRRWALPVTLFVTGATASVFVAPAFAPALGLWRAYVLEPLLLFVMASDVMTHDPEAKKRGAAPVLAALGATLSVVGAIAIFQKLTGYGIPNPAWQAEATRRATAFYGFPNAIGLMAAPVTVLMAAWSAALLERAAAPAGAHLAARERRAGYAHAALAALTALLGACGIVFARSEGGAIGTLAGLGLFALLHPRLRAWALGGAGAALVATLAVPALRAYVTSLVTLSDDSGAVRRVVWGESWRMLQDNAVFGAGLSGYPARLLPYHASDWVEVFQYPHDVALNFWSETGLIGLLGFAWIMAAFFVLAARARREARGAHGHEWLAAALMAAMAATLVHGLVDVPYFKNDLAMLTWLLIAMAEAMRQRLAPPPAPAPKPEGGFAAAKRARLGTEHHGN